MRRFIGSGMDDLGFHERWLVIDVLLKRDRDDLGDYSIQHCDPQRPATYVRGTGTRRRWEITILPDEDSQDVVQPAKVWELLSRWITPEDAEIERAPSTPSTPPSRSNGAADGCCSPAIPRTRRRPSSGRACAPASATPPTSPGSSPRSCPGRADAGLLDTYQSERQPHAARIH